MSASSGSARGEQAFFEAGDDHGGELEPLGRVHRHEPDARVGGSLLLVDLGEQRQPVDEAAQRRLGVARFVLAGGEINSARFSSRPSASSERSSRRSFQ